MQSRTGRHTIAFNGEIYNFRALRTELEARGHAFRTGTDTEVLLALYAEHGTAMLGRLRGMYAFALWDEEERTLVLARDPLGIKPLYLSDDGRVVRAASQVRALVAGGGVDSEPDSAGVVGFLVWGHVPEPFTLHRGIRSLVPGEVAVFRAGESPRRRVLCRVSDVLGGGDERGCLPLVQESGIRAPMFDSVRAHLESDVPVGLFLSAGLDSRSIARLCHDADANVVCVTLGFEGHEGSPVDEVPLAKEVAASFGFRHEVTRIGRRDFDEQLESVLSSMDQPSIDGVNTWWVSRVASALGLKVALSGLGGDELLGGYPSFREVPGLARALGAVTAAPSVARGIRRLLLPLLPRSVSPKWASLLEYGGTLGGAYLLRRGLFMPWELPRVVDEGFAREGWETLGTLGALEGTVSGLKTDRLRVTALETAWYMRNQLLRDADWAGMAHSLEIRVPYVDLELTRRLLPALARTPAATKEDAIRAVEPAVPREVLSRPKTGFVPPVSEWVRMRGDEYTGRGLRGWARLILDRFVPDVRGLRPRARAGEPTAGGVPVPGGRKRRQILVSTLPPSWGGGVPRMARFTAECLAETGAEPILAWYRPLSEDPYLSPGLHRLGIGKVGERVTTAFDGVEGHEIGARLPEFEARQYSRSPSWARLLERADECFVASGNCLAGRPFLDCGVPFMAWIATPWRDDRRAREGSFGWARRAGELLVTRAAVEGLEREILGSAYVVALSRYTASRLDEVAGAQVTRDVLPVPIDLDRFRPSPSAVVRGRIGFVGRLGDPRKRAALFVEAIALASRKADVHGVLIGGPLPTDALDAARRLGVSDRLEVQPYVTESELPGVLQSLDVFLLSSEQEGLCIAALEAMACGAPVVSTRCGGPEEFVIDGGTGILCEGSAVELGEAVATLVQDRMKRDVLGRAARREVEEHYSSKSVRERFFDCVTRYRETAA